MRKFEVRLVLYGDYEEQNESIVTMQDVREEELAALILRLLCDTKWNPRETGIEILEIV